LSPVACMRWVGHGPGRVYARAGVLVRRLGCYGENVYVLHPNRMCLASVLRVATHAAGSGCLNCHGN
jgi:hypothetical protein